MGLGDPILVEWGPLVENGAVVLLYSYDQLRHQYVPGGEATLFFLDLKDAEGAQMVFEYCQTSYLVHRLRLATHLKGLFLKMRSLPWLLISKFFD